MWIVDKVKRIYATGADLVLSMYATITLLMLIFAIFCMDLEKIAELKEKLKMTRFPGGEITTEIATEMISCAEIPVDTLVETPMETPAEIYNP